MSKGESYIEVEGDLANKVIRIKATGAIAWTIATISVSVYMIVWGPAAAAATGGVAGPAEVTAGIVASGSAVTILGFGPTAAAVALAVSAGGVGVLTRLRSGYKIIEQTQDRIILKKTNK